MTEENDYRESNKTRESYELTVIGAMSDPQQPLVHPDTGAKIDVKLPTGPYAKEPVVKPKSTDSRDAKRFINANMQAGSLEEREAQTAEILRLLEAPLSRERTDRRTALPDDAKRLYVGASQFVQRERARRERR